MEASEAFVETTPEVAQDSYYEDEDLEASATRFSEMESLLAAMNSVEQEE